MPIGMEDASMATPIRKISRALLICIFFTDELLHHHDALDL
jgi:hypothetical protein